MHGNVVLLQALLASAIIARCFAVCVPTMPTTSSTCEEDEVTLLHARQASLPKGEHHEERPDVSMMTSELKYTPATKEETSVAKAAKAEGGAESVSTPGFDALVDAEMNTLLNTEPSVPTSELKSAPATKEETSVAKAAKAEGGAVSTPTESKSPGFDALMDAEMATLLNTEPGFPGWMGSNLSKGLVNKSSDQVLFEVGHAVRVSSYSGAMGMFMLFTLLAFVCSCCAVTVTRAFIQDQRQTSDSLAQHERRQRLLQSFASSVRTPKKGPEGMPSPTPGTAGAGSAVAVPPTTPTRRAGVGLRSPWRRVVVDTPLEGDRLGVNLTEDTLIIIDYTDPRAESLGFKVGERVVHINGVPVFQQLDFQKVLSGAFREFHRARQPIVISTVEPASSYPNNLNLLPEMEDICGRWQMTNGEVFVISRLPGLQYLLMTMLAGGRPSASGLMMVHSAEELRCQLLRTDGSNLGDVRICYRENMMEVTFSSPQGGTWGQPLAAWRATGDACPSPQTGASLPRPTVQSSPPESLPPSTLH